MRLDNFFHKNTCKIKCTGRNSFLYASKETKTMDYFLILFYMENFFQTGYTLVLNCSPQLQLQLQYCCCGAFCNRIAAAITATSTAFSCNFSQLQ